MWLEEIAHFVVCIDDEGGSGIVIAFRFMGSSIAF